MLKTLGLSSLDKRSLRGELIAFRIFLRKVSVERGAYLFSHYLVIG